MNEILHVGLDVGSTTVKIIVMDKNIKKGVKEILEDKTITQDPVVVMQFLLNNKGDIKETIKNLKSMNSNKIIL